MTAIRCTSCGLKITGEDHKDLKLMSDIRTWINYVLSIHLQQGETAKHLNKQKDCPPCPSCKAVGQWENVV